MKIPIVQSNNFFHVERITVQIWVLYFTTSSFALSNWLKATEKQDFKLASVCTELKLF